MSSRPEAAAVLRALVRAAFALTAAVVTSLPAAAQNHRPRGPDTLLPQPRTPVAVPVGCCGPLPGATTCCVIDDSDSWQCWWAMHADVLLPVRDPVRGPSQVAVAEQAIPALRAALVADDSVDGRIAAACAIALAKIARHEPVAGLRDGVLVPMLDRPGLRGLAAAYAFGVAADGSPAALAALDRVANAPRRAVEQRAAALFALGLIAAARANAGVQSAVVASLATAARGGVLDDPELGVPLVRALGMLRTHVAGERAGVEKILFAALARRDGNESSAQILASHALTALAAFVEPADADGEYVRGICRTAAARGLRPRSGRNEVARAAVLALAQLALPHDTVDDDDLLLLRVFREHLDAQTRAYAVVALGRIGGAANAEALAAAMPRAMKSIERPWLAMAMAQWASGASGEARDARLASFGAALQSTMAETKDPNALAGEALSLGVCRVREAADDLERRLTARRCYEDFAGPFCIALALLRGVAAAPAIEPSFAAAAEPPFLAGAASAYAVAAPAIAGSQLLQVLRGPRGDALEPAGAIASAIGATQNVALIGPLAAILRERGASAVQRAAAAVAIGCLCDREPRPWNAELAATGDYRAATRSLLDPETGVLSWW